jgi:hypothetical protein
MAGTYLLVWLRTGTCSAIYLPLMTNLQASCTVYFLLLAFRTVNHRVEYVEYLLVWQFFLKDNISLRKENNYLLLHIVTLKIHLSQRVISERMLLAQNSGLCDQNHCETAYYTCISYWQLWPPRCFFRGFKMWKSLGAKTTHSATGSLVAAFCVAVSWTCTVQLWCCSHLCGSVLNMHCTAVVLQPFVWQCPEHALYSCGVAAICMAVSWTSTVQLWCCT